VAHTVSLLAGADAATKEVVARRAFTGVNAGVTNRKQGGVRTILADSVLPAPDSPEMRIACRCSSIIMLENACGRQMTRDVAPDHSLRPPPQAAGQMHGLADCSTSDEDHANLLGYGVDVRRQLPKRLAAVLRTHAAAVQVPQPFVRVHLRRFSTIGLCVPSA